MVNNCMLQFGDFTLKSGRVSPYLIHSGYNLTGSQIYNLGEFYAECIREHGIEANCLIGINNRDIPLVIATSMTLYGKYGVDSAHCVDDNIKNDAFASHEITLITDTFTSGATLKEALERIKDKTGKYPSHIVVCVDRMEKTASSDFSAKHEIEQLYGVKMYSIVNADDIVTAIENGVLSASEHYEKMKLYVKKYKGQ